MRHTSSVLTVFLTTDEKLTLLSKPNRKVNVWAQTQTMTTSKPRNSIIILDIDTLMRMKGWCNLRFLRNMYLSA